MDQLKALWNGLTPLRRLIVAGAAVATFAALMAMARMATTPGLVLLYAGLEPQAAGEVLERLGQRGIRHEVRGDAVFVPAPERDSLRMALAAEGLPANGARGYELLDGLSGFGTTAQMFDAAYWRAKEGELARTIVASPQFRAARVHIAQAPGSGFRRGAAPGASVFVTAAGGATTPAQARALRFLVAAAVAGLEPEGVSVIDAAVGLVTGSEDRDALPGGESDRAEALRRNVLRLVEAHVGPGRAVVEVSVETVTERESMLERRLDPSTRVAISSDTEETSSESDGPGTAAVGVASNLPDGEAAATDGTRSRQTTTRERVNYEVTEIQREVHRAPGAVRRITVAVLVDAAGLVARPDAEGAAPDLAPLRELIAAAVGYDAERGDAITLHALPFEERPEVGSGPATAGLAWPTIDPMALMQLAVLAVVALILGLFVLRPLLGRALAASAPDTPALEGGAVGALGLPGPDSDTVTAAIVDPGAGWALPAPQDASEAGPETMSRAAGTAVAQAELMLPDDPVLATAEPVRRLRSLIEARKDETVEILRAWMEEAEEGT